MGVNSAMSMNLCLCCREGEKNVLARTGPRMLTEALRTYKPELVGENKSSQSRHKKRASSIKSQTKEARSDSQEQLPLYLPVSIAPPDTFYPFFDQVDFVCVTGVVHSIFDC